MPAGIPKSGADSTLDFRQHAGADEGRRWAITGHRPARIVKNDVKLVSDARFLGTMSAMNNGNGSATGDGRRPMIEAQGLSKNFGQFVATKDVSFTVPRGAVVAFLGPNGAGKSTTMKLLTGYLAPTAGTARIAGFDMSTDRIEA